MKTKKITSEIILEFKRCLEYKDSLEGMVIYYDVTVKPYNKKKAYTPLSFDKLYSLKIDNASSWERETFFIPANPNERINSFAGTLPNYFDFHYVEFHLDDYYNDKLFLYSDSRFKLGTAPGCCGILHIYSGVDYFINETSDLFKEKLLEKISKKYAGIDIYHNRELDPGLSKMGWVCQKIGKNPKGNTIYRYSYMFKKSKDEKTFSAPVEEQVEVTVN
jgi:hypothetical protein